MPGKLRWASPQLRMEDEEHRKASWLILFYDLVFVVTVVRLTTILHEDVSWESLGKYIILFIPIWWVWTATTTYDHLFAVDDISHRISIFLQMIPVVMLAVYVTEAMNETDGTSWEFAWAYILARVLLAALWLRAGFRNEEIWNISRRLAAGYSLSILFWLVSLTVDEPLRYVLWGVGLSIDLVTPLFVTTSGKRFIRTFGHLAERYGLIVLIVLGETIISVVRALVTDEEGLSRAFAITGGLGMLLAFTIWWLYFDEVTEKSEHRAPRRIATWGYAHLPFVMGIAAIGAAMNFAVTGDPQHLPDDAHWLLAGAVASVLIALSILELLGDEPISTRVLLFRWGGAVVAVVIALLQNEVVSDQINSIALLVALIGIMVVQIVQSQWSSGVLATQEA